MTSTYKFVLVDEMFYKVEDKLNELLEKYKKCNIESTVWTKTRPNFITLILLCEKKEVS